MAKFMCVHIVFRDGDSLEASCTELDILRWTEGRIKALVPGCWVNLNQSSSVDKSIGEWDCPNNVSAGKLKGKAMPLMYQLARELMGDGWEPLKVDIAATLYPYFILKKKID